LKLLKPTPCRIHSNTQKKKHTLLSATNHPKKKSRRRIGNRITAKFERRRRRREDDVAIVLQNCREGINKEIGLPRKLREGNVSDPPSAAFAV
jgi:hypothetical protein